MIRYLTLWPTVSLLKPSNIWAVAMMRAVYKMPLFNQPIHLEKLSLHSLAKYLSDICVRLMISCRTSSASLPEALATCQRLRCVIHDKIPYSMANRVTSEVLEYLGSRYDEVSDCIDHSSSCKDILQHFVNAILHPQVTELDILGIHILIVNTVLDHIDTLSQLKIFRACVKCEESYDSFKHLLLQNLPSLKNLKCFTVPRWSSNEIIRVLFKSAPGLTHLDVSESKGVTDESIDIILTFPSLQSLDVSKTGISKSGYKYLLDRSRSCLHLQDFGLNVVDSSDILSLPHCFQGLRRLSLNMGFNDIYLDNIAQLLQGVEELKLSAFRVPSLPYFSTLKVLILDVRELEDMGDLPKSCPCLEKLMINAFFLECRVFTGSFTHLCRLSVSVCHTDTRSIDALLSAAPNLVTFHFNKEGSSLIFIAELLCDTFAIDRLKNLSMFSVNGCIDSKELSCFMHKCSRLTTCETCGDARELIKVWYQACAGLIINEVKWCRMHLHHHRL
ncbi:uncharacterized protein [Periplaneta americana]|uniref:uncharacterized protein isoform X1 n=1 Tax=Periplaneta americana TaxID=6978 RepID=UPI0037E77A41